ncbi:MAG: hypothetical protein U0Q55_04480 [Vicinamibacterales bacterium]
MTESAEHWRKVEAIWQGASGLSTAERAPFVREARGGDKALLRDIEVLLAADSGAGGILDQTLDAAAAVMSGAAAPLPGAES